VPISHTLSAARAFPTSTESSPNGPGPITAIESPATKPPTDSKPYRIQPRFVKRAASAKLTESGIE